MDTKKIERVDSIPLLYSLLSRMEIAELIDSLWQSNRNWQGLSYGKLVVLFLMYVISTRNHRLSKLEEWVVLHQQVLQAVTGWEIRDKEGTDDRIGHLLGELGVDEAKRLSYQRLAGSHLIQAYELPTEVARYDTTSVNVHHGSAPEEGILSFGYSKDHRPDLLQFKQGLGTLDPNGVPLLSQTLKGNGADDPLYLPAWQEMRQIIGHASFLFVGDSKGNSLACRSGISSGGGSYLFPASQTGEMPDLLAAWVTQVDPAQLEAISAPDKRGRIQTVGQGFSVVRTITDEETDHTWQEQCFVIQSFAMAEKQQRSLLHRIEQAESNLKALKAKPQETAAQFEQRATQIIKKYRVSQFLSCSTSESHTLEKKFIGRGRPGPDRPYRFISTRHLHLTIDKNQSNIDQALNLCGWRIYLSNRLPSQLSVQQASQFYRGQWSNEHGYHRFKKGSLPVLPLFIRIPDRIIGLMFLLMIALQALTLLDFVAHRELAARKSTIKGLVPGNPSISTARPSAERLLDQFQHLHLLIFDDGSFKLFEPLSDLQLLILNILGLSPDIYTNLIYFVPP
jgi:transposase